MYLYCSLFILYSMVARWSCDCMKPIFNGERSGNTLQYIQYVTYFPRSNLDCSLKMDLEVVIQIEESRGDVIHITVIQIPTFFKSQGTILTN